LLTDDEIGRLIRIAVTDLGITEVRSGAPDEQIAELWAGRLTAAPSRKRAPDGGVWRA